MPWWRKEAPDVIIGETFEEILWEAQIRQIGRDNKYGEVAGAGAAGIEGCSSRDAGMETGDAQVGRGPCRSDRVGTEAGTGTGTG